MNKYKVCKQCEAKKLLSEYHKGKGNKFGVRTICKICRNSNKVDKYKNGG